VVGSGGCGEITIFVSFFIIFFVVLIIFLVVVFFAFIAFRIAFALALNNVNTCKNTELRKISRFFL
jgi:hypothetical protein